MKAQHHASRVVRRKVIRKGLAHLPRTNTRKTTENGDQYPSEEVWGGNVSEPTEEFPYRQLFFSDSICREAQFKHLLDCFMGVKHVQQMQPLTDEQLKQHRLELPTPNNGQKTLFLDLDETLIHTSIDPSVKFEHHMTITIGGQPTKISFRMRPYCLEFLKAVSQHYEVYIFTASNEDYAQAAMRFLNESSPTITGSLSRESCLRTSLGIYIKDIMRITNRMPHQMLLVDNLAYSFGHMIDNGIPVVEFIGDQSDKELPFLEKYLIECAKHEDLMKFNREHLKLRNIVEHLGKYFYAR